MKRSVLGVGVEVLVLVVLSVVMLAVFLVPVGMER